MATRLGRPITPLRDRLEPKIKRGRNSDDCWVWIGAVSGSGYATVHVYDGPGKYRDLPAHRVVYELYVGKIRKGMTLDHTCHNRDRKCNDGSQCRHRRCVNPAHMEQVRSRINTLRGRTPAARNAAKTHCLRGHEFTPENTYHPPKKPRARDCRLCRTCRSDASARYRERQR